MRGCRPTESGVLDTIQHVHRMVNDEYSKIGDGVGSITGRPRTQDRSSRWRGT